MCRHIFFKKFFFAAYVWAGLYPKITLILMLKEVVVFQFL